MRISDWSSDVCSSDLVDRHPVGAGLKIIDHLTHNVYGGRMAHWAAFYERIAGFREIRYFVIKGEYTRLTSKAMPAPDGQIRIPLHEKGAGRSDERRVGQSHVSLFRSRWYPYREKKKITPH